MEKINKFIVVRLYFVLIIWCSLFFPTVFLPGKIRFRFFWPIFSKLFLFATKLKPHHLSDFNIESFGNVIYACNHKCFVDTYFITNLLRKPFTLVFRGSVFKSKLFKFMAWRAGLIPIEKSNSISTKEAFEKVRKKVDKKHSIIIFPEGWYCDDKPVGEMKRGVAKIANELNILTVPIAIYGISNDFRLEKKLLWRDVYIKAGRPIDYKDFNDETLYLDHLKSRIEELYYEIEAEVTKGRKV